jgi:glutaredoxin-related protein
MSDDINQKISNMVGGNDVLLFMKGTPLFPQCGFSSRAVAILDHLGVGRALRPFLTGQPFPSFMLKANLLAAPTL